MSESIRARLRAVEKRMGASIGERRGFTLEQLILAAHGKEPGPPENVLKPGELSLEELILATSARSTPSGD